MLSVPSLVYCFTVLCVLTYFVTPSTYKQNHSCDDSPLTSLSQPPTPLKDVGQLLFEPFKSVD